VEFTDDDLKELGVSTPHRKNLLHAIGLFNVNPSLSDQVSINLEPNISSYI